MMRRYEGTELQNEANLRVWGWGLQNEANFWLFPFRIMSYGVDGDSLHKGSYQFPR